MGAVSLPDGGLKRLRLLALLFLVLGGFGLAGHDKLQEYRRRSTAADLHSYEAFPDWTFAINKSCRLGYRGIWSRLLSQGIKRWVE
jgi:hypothetical protein